ncbi:hypothetical protein OG563_09500 [Nocardia vinacea]|uniref:Uncharacterized protein n=1 Tax=Nocardia vinacea TaxID=96468 RepID=A0ABZ1YYP6_9NOCA|nr:hypothetical protein [Nocardia vinacea]
MDQTAKVRENRLRRAASRQGLRLVKSRRRDPRATDFERFWLYDHRDRIVYGGKPGTTLDAIEARLQGDT